jgi:hypothetical protein
MAREAKAAKEAKPLMHTARASPIVILRSILSRLVKEVMHLNLY